MSWKALQKLILEKIQTFNENTRVMDWFILSRTELIFFSAGEEVWIEGHGEMVLLHFTSLPGAGVRGSHFPGGGHSRGEKTGKSQ